MPLLDSLSTWQTGLVVVGAFVAASLAGLLLFQRLSRGRMRLSSEMNGEVVFFASAIGVFYSLTAGLLAVGVWQRYADVQGGIFREAAAIAVLYRDVSGYPAPLRDQLRADLREYTEQIVTRSWPAQRSGQLLDDVTRKSIELGTRLFAHEPATPGQQALHAEVLQRYGQLVELRRQRIAAVGGTLHPVMWAVVLLGAFLSISATYPLRTGQGLHLGMTGLLATFIGLVVFVIIGLDRPLSGALAISPRPYQLVLERLMDLPAVPP